MSRSWLPLVLGPLVLPVPASARPQRTQLDALPPARTGPVDPGTAGRILALLDGATGAQELQTAVGLEPLVAADVLRLRALRPDGRFGSFDELDGMWRLDPGIFPRLYHVLGPPSMGLWETLPYRTPYSCAHSILLHTGKVLLLPESDALSSRLWDPSDLENPVFLAPANQPAAPAFCSGHAQLSDGRILVAGGGGGSPGPDSSRAFVFDPDADGNGRWSELPRMHFERWYPTVVTLGGGYVLIACGDATGLVPVAEMEVFDERAGRFTLVTGPAGDPDGANLSWSETYPGLHLLPSGHVLFTRTGFGHQTSEPGTRAQYFTWTDPLDPTSGLWRETPPMVFPDRTEGMSVQLPIRAHPRLALQPRVAVFGGDQPATAPRQTVEVFESDGAARTAWVRKPDMVEPRFHCMAVLMADGKVLVAGGVGHGGTGETGSHSSEIYDPETGTLARAADTQFARGYHSLCALLPSGQVMIGGGLDGPNELTLEVFSPPYLFRGPRPVIAAAPEAVAHGDAFEVETPDAARIARAVLVRPIAFTHDTDSEQRVVELLVQPGDGRVRIKAPGGEPPYPGCPAGYYMLFLLDLDGVPSVARFVRLVS